MNEDNSNKEKALAAALSQIERQFGKGSMMRLGDTEREAIPVIPTGSLGLDVAPVSYTHLTLPTNREV